MKRLVLAGLVALAGMQTRAEMFTVTAYCHCAKCCGKWAATGRTASGTKPAAGVTVAAPRRLPFGTKLVIPGLGERVVQDRLARRFDDRIDVYFSNHNQALKWGIKRLEVTIK